MAVKPAKTSNRKLSAAKKAKNDEFYTQLPDIEKELKHYKQHFKGKTVLCNCDDPLESNFVEYFSRNFEHLGLKKLIATHYQESNLFSTEPAYKLEYTGDKNGNKVPDRTEFITELLDDGDFRSPECEDLLEEADIVVTNPPFSKFREYVDQLMQFEKKFLIIGSINAVTYKEIFPLLKENRMWVGPSITSGGREFEVPKDFVDMAKFTGEIRDGRYYQEVMGVRWFTNLSHEKRSESITLYKKYSPKEYPKYDNYDAINVDKVATIPLDYDGVMGVPISFMDKYNPKQFKILGFDYDIKQGLLPGLVKPGWKGKLDRGYIKGQRMYSRILIRNRKVKK